MLPYNPFNLKGGLGRGGWPPQEPLWASQESPCRETLIKLNLETLLYAREDVHRFFLSIRFIELARVSLRGLVTLRQTSFPNRSCVFQRRRLSIIIDGSLCTLRFTLKICKSAANIPSQITAPIPKKGILKIKRQSFSIERFQAEVI